MQDLSVRDASHQVKTHKEFDQLPDTMLCSRCGEPMEFISEELMFSCPTPDCPFHVSEAI
jgi:hypothetical protein